ncbi:hypothetical protein G3I24_00130 [Micromonospora aurantiaca]|nr:hypothetical protein [Micromonospora aurantiaca]
MAASKRLIVRIAVLDIAVITVSPVANYYLPPHQGPDLYLMTGAALIGAITFLGVWYVQRMHLLNGSSVAMRDAIAAAFVLTYLPMVGWSAFSPYVREGDPVKQLPMAQNLLNNFTYLTGTVVVFYFGAQAIAAAIDSRSRSQDRKNPAAPAASNESTGS